MESRELLRNYSSQCDYSRVGGVLVLDEMI